MITLGTDNKNDIFLDASGRAVIITDPVLVGAIKLRNRLLLFKGEWYLDTRIGFPWFQYVLVKNPDMGLIQRLLTRAILGTEPFVSVDTLDLTFDPVTRALNIEFRARAADGRTLSGGTDTPFIVSEKP